MKFQQHRERGWTLIAMYALSVGIAIGFGIATWLHHP